MKTILIAGSLALLLQGVALPASSGAQPADELPQAGSTVTHKTGGAAAPSATLKKIRKLELAIAEEQGEDEAALERVAGKIGLKLGLMPFNDELVAVLADQSVDWRVRYAIMLHHKYTASEKDIAGCSDGLTKIMRDKKEHERVRAMSTMMLLELASKNADIGAAMEELAGAPDTPGEVLKAVMTVVGYSGANNAEMLLKLAAREPSEPNELGISLNAIRALGKSKDPRAIGYLIKIFDENVPDSFYNYAAIEQFWGYVRDVETRDTLKPLIVPRFLRLLDDRSYLGASRQEAAAILAELGVKEAVDPILRWFLPANQTHAKIGGGGNRMDVFFGANALVQLGDARAIPVLKKTITDFAVDSRWSWVKERMEGRGERFPSDEQDYKHLEECLKKLKKRARKLGNTDEKD